MKSIGPGCHLNVIGSHQPMMREVSSDIIIQSKIIVDQLEACKKEAGDPYNPNERKYGPLKMYMANWEWLWMVQFL